MQAGSAPQGAGPLPYSMPGRSRRDPTARNPSPRFLPSGSVRHKSALLSFTGVRLSSLPCVAEAMSRAALRRRSTAAHSGAPFQLPAPSPRRSCCPCRRLRHQRPEPAEEFSTQQGDAASVCKVLMPARPQGSPTAPVDPSSLPHPDSRASSCDARSPQTQSGRRVRPRTDRCEPVRSSQCGPIPAQSKNPRTDCGRPTPDRTAPCYGRGRCDEAGTRDWRKCPCSQHRRSVGSLSNAFSESVGGNRFTKLMVPPSERHDRRVRRWSNRRLQLRRNEGGSLSVHAQIHLTDEAFYPSTSSASTVAASFRRRLDSVRCQLLDQHQEMFGRRRWQVEHAQH